MLMIRISIILLIILLGNSSRALIDNTRQPIHINSQHAILQKNNMTYSQDVLLRQGTQHLKADQVTTILDKNGKIQKAFATALDGRYVHYWSITKIDEPLLCAIAHKIIINYAKSELELIGEASITQNEHSFSANHIVYYIKEDKIKTNKKGVTLMFKTN